MKDNGLFGLKAVYWGLICAVVSTVDARAADDRLSLRWEYNAVSAEIDSLVRAMEAVDPDAAEAARLPEGERSGMIPRGMSLSLIFWADDEARVWINDYPVGETRLTPLEVKIPELYLRPQNRIRVRCWDTNWIESGFLCGLYLKDAEGRLFRVLVSDQAWRAEGAQAREIAYAHPVPDIPDATVIWGSSLFGTVEMERTFEIGEITRALSEGAIREERPPRSVNQTMEYDTFLRSLTHLQKRRVELGGMLADRRSDKLDYPVYSGREGKSLSLTLGRAGPLREWATTPVAEQVLAWSRRLPERVAELLFPQARALKGEGEANPSYPLSAVGEAVGDRQAAYRPPKELGSGSRERSSGRGRSEEGLKGRTGRGQPDGSAAFGAGGSWTGKRRSRNGLWIPTAILAIYVTYGFLSHRQDLMRS